MTISKMLSGVQSIRLEEQVPVIIEQTKEKAIELNKLQLYNSSINKEGMRLELYRFEWYASMKNQKNPNPGLFHPDLYLTGAFYGGFKMTVTESTFNITSSDSKTFELVKKYGDDIFGLTDQSKGIYAKGVVYEGIKAYVTSKSGLRFN